MAKWKASYTWDTPPSATGAPPRLKIATCQIPVSHSVDRNLEGILGLIRAASAAGADVAHFPECALSGYGPASWPSWEDFDWAALEGAFREVQVAARGNAIWVVTGSVHRTSAEARPTNSLCVLNRRGEFAGRYDKRRCSINDLSAFAPGDKEFMIDIDGVRCGFLICLDWAFPELWNEYAGRAELIFHSCVADNTQKDRNAAHVIPALMQGYAWLNQYAISVSNSCRPSQDFPSLWIERSGHMGGRACRDEAGFTVNVLANDPEQDRFFDMVRSFRVSAGNESLYASHRQGPAGAASPQGGAKET